MCNHLRGQVKHPIAYTKYVPAIMVEQQKEALVTPMEKNNVRVVIQATTRMATTSARKKYAPAAITPATQIGINNVNNLNP